MFVIDIEELCKISNSFFVFKVHSSLYITYFFLYDIPVVLLFQEVMSYSGVLGVPGRTGVPQLLGTPD